MDALGDAGLFVDVLDRLAQFPAWLDHRVEHKAILTVL
jgi:hypothetical protein